jgi:hypothetical protein
VKKRGRQGIGVYFFTIKTLSPSHGFAEKSSRNGEEGAEGRKEASLQVFLFAFAVKNSSTV